MKKKRKDKPLLGTLTLKTKQDIIDLEDTLEAAEEKATKWREKYFELYRKVYSASTKEQLDLI